MYGGSYIKRINRLAERQADDTDGSDYAFVNAYRASSGYYPADLEVVPVAPEGVAATEPLASINLGTDGTLGALRGAVKRWYEQFGPFYLYKVAGDRPEYCAYKSK